MYLWLHFDELEEDDNEFGVSKTIIIALSVSLVLRELILSIIAFFYERATYAFFKD